MAYRFILLRLNPFGFRADREEWWFELSVSWFQVCLAMSVRRVGLSDLFVSLCLYIYNVYIIYICVCVCVCVCVSGVVWYVWCVCVAACLCQSFST